MRSAEYLAMEGHTMQMVVVAVAGASRENFGAKKIQAWAQARRA